MGRLQITQSRGRVDASAHEPGATDPASISWRVNADVEHGATFVVVTGAPDAGTTRLCDLVVKSAGRRSFPLVIEAPPRDFDAFLIDVLRSFDCLGNPGRTNRPVSRDDLVALMRRFLQSMSSLHGEVLLVFDHAHRLTPHLIEELHALTTFQPDGHAVLHIVLVGEPSLLETLRADGLRDIERVVSRRYRLVAWKPPRSRRRGGMRDAAWVVSRWWVALAITPALLIVAFTGSWAIRHDIVFSEKAETDAGSRAIGGYLPPAIASPAVSTRPASGTSVKTDHRVAGGSTASTKPVDRVPAPVTLGEILGRAEAFAAEPDVKALLKLREEVANRIPLSTDDTERQAIASTLNALDRRLEEARRRQLAIDGRRLAGRGGRRPATDAPPSQ